MQKNKILFLLFLVISLTSFAQNLTCKDFKIGKFYIPQTEELKAYTITLGDSVSTYMPETDSSIQKYIIMRAKKTQMEWTNGINEGTPIHVDLEWIDDCTYRLKYNKTKNKLNDDMLWINENNGIVVTNMKIEGNCMFYKSTLTTKEGKTIAQKGIICKEF